MTRKYTKAKPRAYIINDEVINTYRPQLNGSHDYCPRCSTGQLIRDMNDLTCLECGWRECLYFSDSPGIDPFEVQVLMYNSRLVPV